MGGEVEGGALGFTVARGCPFLSCQLIRVVDAIKRRGIGSDLAKDETSVSKGDCSRVQTQK
jgi:hypothetical protein